MSRHNKLKEEYYRSFSVTETRTHEKGHTEYRVTARFVSKRHPEDVKEVAVWRRFSELKRLHSELSFTHRNLFRREEEFPPFPRAQLFGRFEQTVIEERRKAAETMLMFTTSIPALYNSPHLKEFFTGGEVSRPLDPSSLPPLSSSSSPLPPPLIPLPRPPRRRPSDCQPVEEEEGSEAPAPPQARDSDRGPPELGELEVAAEAYREMGGTPTQEEEEDEDEDDELSHASLNDEGPSPDPPLSRAHQSRESPDPLLSRAHQSRESQEEFDSLFDSLGEGPTPQEGPPPLSVNDLAIFDPCCRQDHVTSPGDHSELFSLPLANQEAGEAGYLAEAANQLAAAMQREREGEFSSAIVLYRTAVDILITGVKGDSDAGRRELVKRRTAQYLKHAEMLVDTHSSPTHTHTHEHAHTQQP